MTAIKILEYEELDSTNDEAKRLVRDAAAGEAIDALYGTVIAAKRQSAGKGRRGKTFFSRGGDSVYASFILKPPENLAEQTITTLAGVAVCEAIAVCTLYKPVIKGVNDIMADGRKVCGILAEGIPNAVILGIGININIEENDFPEELRDIAGSLHLSKADRVRFFNTLVESVLNLEY